MSEEGMKPDMKPQESSESSRWAKVSAEDLVTMSDDEILAYETWRERRSAAGSNTARQVVGVVLIVLAALALGVGVVNWMEASELARFIPGAPRVRTLRVYAVGDVILAGGLGLWGRWLWLRGRRR